MTTNANAPVETRHKDEAAKAREFLSWADLDEVGTRIAKSSALAHAQTLANLEAARADLAEMSAAILDALPWTEPGKCISINQRDRLSAIAAPYRASEPAPQPVTSCPDCEAFKREVSDAVSKFNMRWANSALRQKDWERLLAICTKALAQIERKPEDGK